MAVSGRLAEGAGPTGYLKRVCMCVCIIAKLYSYKRILLRLLQIQGVGGAGGRGPEEGRGLFSVPPPARARALTSGHAHISHTPHCPSGQSQRGEEVWGVDCGLACRRQVERY